VERLLFPPSAAREWVATQSLRIAGLLSFARRRADLLLAVTLAVVAGLVGGVAVAGSEQGSYYQPEFGPAVMRACGLGYVNYLGKSGSVVDFLGLESSSLDCSAVDPALQRRPNAFATAHRYLLESAAFIWRLDEVSWDALIPLFAALYAVAGAALFGIFRLFVGRLLATLGALVLIFSPLQLDMLRELRDYSKTPFLLAAFFLGGLLATTRLSPRIAVLAGALAGLFLGVGFGFRADVLVALPILVAAVVAFWPGHWRDSIKTRLATLGAFGAVFVLTALPVILTLSSGGNLYLMGVHGQTVPFTESLGLEQDLYNAGSFYNDPYAVSLTNAHDLLIDGNVRKLKLATAALDEASSSRYNAVVRHLPADFLARADASVLQVLDSAPDALAEPVPQPVDALGVPGVARAGLAKLLGPFEDGWIVLLAALIVGAARSPRLAVGALLAVLFLGSLISFQPSVRHSFYLEFIWWVAVAYLTQEAWGMGVRLWRLRARGRDMLRSFSFRRPALGVGILGIVLIATTIAPLAAARAYQADHLEAILADYESARKAPVATSEVSIDSGRTLVSVPNDSPAWRGTAGLRVALFAVRFDGRRCEYPSLNPVVRYQSQTVYENWSRALEVRFPRRGDARVTMYFVAFALPTTHFTGIELPTAALACLEAFDVVTDTSRLPVLLDVALTADWRQATRFQTFSWEDRRGTTEGKAYVVASPPTSYSYPELTAGAELAGSSASWRAEGVESIGVSGLRYSGSADGPYTYLSVSNPVKLAAGQEVFVHGRLRHGGILVGLQRDQQWVLNVVAAEEGEFWAVLKAPDTGTYQIVIANQLEGHDLRQEVVIEDVRTG
jgi:hypothetical protein